MHLFIIYLVISSFLLVHMCKTFGCVSESGITRSLGIWMRFYVVVYVRHFLYLWAGSYFDYILRCLLRCFISICPLELCESLRAGTKYHWFLVLHCLTHCLVSQRHLFSWISLRIFFFFEAPRERIPNHYESNNFYPASGTSKSWLLVKVASRWSWVSVLNLSVDNIVRSWIGVI